MRSGNVDETVYTRAIVGSRVFLSAYGKEAKMTYERRKMFNVSHLGLTCADCGTKIEELPFEPKTDRPVYCQKCARTHRSSNPRVLR